MAFQRKKPAVIGIKAPFPDFIEPALATSVNKVPSGDRWLHKIKFDGYRSICCIFNGYDLRKLPLIERKAHLKKVINGTDIQFSESFEIDGSEMYARACKVGLEGVVSKVRDSKYHSGRGNDWVKKACAQRETLVIAGFALDEGNGAGCVPAALANSPGRPSAGFEYG